MTREHAKDALRLELENWPNGSAALRAVNAICALPASTLYALDEAGTAAIVAEWAYQRGYEDASARHLKAIEEEAAR